MGAEKNFLDDQRIQDMLGEEAAEVYFTVIRPLVRKLSDILHEHQRPHVMVIQLANEETALLDIAASVDGSRHPRLLASKAILEMSEEELSSTIYGDETES